MSINSTWLSRLATKLNRRLNKNGQAYGLTLLAPIKPGQANALRNTLAHIPPVDVDSPLANIPLTHNARFTIIDALPFVGAPALYDHLQNQYLLFSCVFDTGNEHCRTLETDLDTYLQHLFQAMPTETQAIWRYCVDFPEHLTLFNFQAFVRKYQISGGLFFADYPHHSADQVRRSLFEQKHCIDFIIKAQDISDPTQLKNDFYRFYKDLAASPTPPPGSIF